MMQKSHCRTWVSLGWRRGQDLRGFDGNGENGLNVVPFRRESVVPGIDLYHDVVSGTEEQEV